LQVGNQAAADRYTYLPGLGPFLIIGMGVSFMRDRILKNYTAAYKKVIVYLPLILIFVLLSSSTIRQQEIWKNGVSLWEYVVEKSPEDAVAHNNLANAYKNNHDLAIKHYLIALTKVKPDKRMSGYYAEIYYNLAASYKSKGQPDKALLYYEKAVKIKPDAVDAYNNMGVIYFEAGLTDRAIDYYNTALDLKPDYVNAYFNLGEAYFTKGLADESIKHYRAFLKHRPDHADAHYNVGMAYLSKEMTEMAVEHFRAAIRLDPEFKDRILNSQSNKFKKALK
jgi:tetratricopeptide (TPR) repeat protein